VWLLKKLWIETKQPHHMVLRGAKLCGGSGRRPSYVFWSPGISRHHDFVWKFDTPRCRLQALFFFWIRENLISLESVLCGSRWGSKTLDIPGSYKRCMPWLELETYCADLKPFIITLVSGTQALYSSFQCIQTSLSHACPLKFLALHFSNVSM